jgi:hypothetical protein
VHVFGLQAVVKLWSTFQSSGSHPLVTHSFTPGGKPGTMV